VDAADRYGPARSGRLWLVVGGVLAVAALALLPWTVYLTLTLPSRSVTDHWDFVWVGFDLWLAAALMATAVGVLRRATWVSSAAVMAGTLLACDVWFDILLEQPGRKFQAAVLQAVVAELPLAAVCFWIAYRNGAARRGQPR